MHEFNIIKVSIFSIYSTLYIVHVGIIPTTFTYYKLNSLVVEYFLMKLCIY